MKTYFTYEANTFRMKSLQTVKTGSAVYQNLEYAYDDVGNVSGITDLLTSANSQTFTYDALNRLLTATSTSYSPLTYTYDEIGNLTSRIEGAQSTSYTYPASGGSSVRPHAVTTAGPNSYTYDANGNMLTGAGRTFDSYNVENHPTSITSGSATTTFAYDGDGGRVKKQTGSSVTWYISKLYECDATTCTKMIWSGDKRILSKTVATGALLFFHGDHLGSTSVVTDATGTQVQALTYYPFGATRTNVPGNPDVVHKYTGKELDATGLYWYEWRSYDPVLARFTTPDTLVPNPRDPQDLNRYSYVGNNPLRYTDPTGHFKIGKIFKNPIFRAIGWMVMPMPMQYLDQATQRYAIAGTAAMAGAAIAAAPAVAGFAGGGAFGTIFAGTVGGAASGAIGSLGSSAAGYNTNIMRSILAGAAGGAIGSIGGLTSDPLGHIAARGLAGGVTSAIRGGNFGMGFAFSAATAMAHEAYVGLTGFSDIRPGPGGDAVAKDPAASAPAIERADSVGKTNENPEDLAKARDSFCCNEGSALMRSVSLFPFMNAMGGFHDFLTNYDFLGMHAWSNIPTMAPAYGLSVLGGLDSLKLGDQSYSLAVPLATQIRLR